MAAVTIGDLIRPARGAMILSGLLTAAGAVLSIVSFVALTQMAAIWLDEGRHKDWRLPKKCCKSASILKALTSSCSSQSAIKLIATYCATKAHCTKRTKKPIKHW